MVTRNPLNITLYVHCLSCLSHGGESVLLHLDDGQSGGGGIGGRGGHGGDGETGTFPCSLL